MFKNLVKMAIVAGGAAWVVDRFGPTVGLDKLTSNPTANTVIHYAAIGAVSGLTAKLAKAF